MFWGYSPALDFQDVIENTDSLKDKHEINILVIGSADARHILKTMSKYYTRSKKRIINFYMVEVLAELIARQLMLLLIALEPLEELGLKEKVRLWMEVYGNSLVRPKTSWYVNKKSYQLVHLVTDPNFQKLRLPMVCLDNIKYKERDALETCFKFWRENQFNISELWNKRLRQTLGVRYDSKEGIYDWDYHMKLKDRPNGGRINPREYFKWRDSGIAFTWLETEVSESNPTLANGVMKVGDTNCHHGYLGDIVNGPFVALGIQCEDSDMLKTRNGINIKRATDITERNLLRMFYEIANGSAYLPVEDQSIDLGVVITELTDMSVDPKKQSCEIGSSTQESTTTQGHDKKETYSSINIPEIKINFLSLNSIHDIHQKCKFKQFFDLAWISQNLIRRLSLDLVSVVKNNGLLLVENKLYVINLSKEEFDKVPECFRDIEKSCQCELVGTFDYKIDAYATFLIRRN